MKILFLTSRVPYPLDKGDKLRAFYQIRELSKYHEVILVSISEDDTPIFQLKELNTYATKLFLIRITPFERFFSLIRAFTTKLPFSIAWFYSKRIHNLIDTIYYNENPDICFCQLTRMAPYTQNIIIPKAIDYMDAFGIGMLKRSKVVGFLKRYIYTAEAARMLEYEKKIAPEYAHRFIISEQDKIALELPSNVPVQIIPNGIDDIFFENIEEDKIFDLAFVGNMSYLPNIDAVEHLVYHILPKIMYKNITLLVAGVNPHPRIKQLHSNNVIVSGWMNDIRQAYHRSKVFVAPINFGTGQQNKVLEAMAIQLPVVTTESVNNAIGGLDGFHLMVANDDKSFAQKIDLLLSDEALRKKLGKNASQYVKEKYNWEEIGVRLNSIFAAST
ncbi:MAG: glycosyltransferase [Saprospiraceae bacterium]